MIPENVGLTPAPNQSVSPSVTPSYKPGKKPATYTFLLNANFHGEKCMQLASVVLSLNNVSKNEPTHKKEPLQPKYIVVRSKTLEFFMGIRDYPTSF